MNHFAYDPPGGARSGDIRSQIRAIAKPSYEEGGYDYGGGGGGNEWGGYDESDYFQYH
eukprot:CAMPEP_0195304004 /NCGR_PEP_ID=MMETSP0707-20130614/33678_1 /TAXON_ID=33640 /ORGANISM="Asterionellopsis glacialis, Strain CCMP134" /LENGTH=57 /DNA_ID=CAMNT_0040367699 /DNA_START=1 /DNA_END=171 /DNA_ORIENTATION=-